MACDLTRGRSIPCRNLIGGVKFVYFAQFDEVTSISGTTEIDTIAMGTNDIYRYAIRRGNASITETITGSTENGTVVYAPSLNLKLTGLSKEDQNELKLIAQSRVIAFVQLNQVLSNDHNVIMCLGATNGLDLNTGTNQSGAAFADLNGYEWTFEGQEFAPMRTLEDYTTDPLDNAGFTYGTIITS
jgi:hypothetical protein|tara:strand:- start:173 stop:730 length:558 start_codon:yes stop_codon:yes gene_type:complete